MVATRGQGVARLCQKLVMCKKIPIQWFSTREEVVWDVPTWLQFANLLQMRLTNPADVNRKLPNRN